MDCMWRGLGMVRALQLWLGCLLGLLLCAGAAHAQRFVTGRIVDAHTGGPIAEASVALRPSGTGVTSDLSGRYCVRVNGAGTQLEITYPGYAIWVEPVGGREVIDVALVPLVKSKIPEVPVAYGDVVPTLQGGASVVVRAGRFSQRVVTDLGQILAGQVSGLHATSGDGQPGSYPELRIRGFGVPATSPAPLLLLDGMQYRGPLSDIVPFEVSSVTVQKDAAALAIQGARGGGGALLITSKTGSRIPLRQVRLSFSTSHGVVQRAIPTYETVGTEDYYKAVWQMLYNASVSDPQDLRSDAEKRKAASQGVYDKLIYNPFRGVKGNEAVLSSGALNQQIQGLLYGDDLDWRKAIERTAYRGEYNLHLAYRDSSWRAYSSLNYLDEQGFAIRTSHARYALRIGGEYMVKRWLTLGTSARLLRTTQARLHAGEGNSNANPFRFATMIAPIYPIHVHDEQGEYVRDGSGAKRFDYESSRGIRAMPGRNAAAEMRWDDNTLTRDVLEGRASARVQLLRGLSVQSNFSYMLEGQLGKEFFNARLGEAKGRGRLIYRNGRNASSTFNQLLHWDWPFAERYKLGLLVGHESHFWDVRRNAAKMADLTHPDLREFNNFRTREQVESGSWEFRSEGYFARLGLLLADRYSIEGSYRLDGSSRYSRESRWGHYWGVGLGWRIDQEAGLRDQMWLGLLQVRASIGRVGIEPTDPFTGWGSALSTGQYNGTQGGLLYDYNGSTTLRGASQLMTNVALDFALWGRIRGGVELFRKDSHDLHALLPVPPSSGFAGREGNLGRIRYDGIELSLDVTLVEQGQFRWEIGASATKLRSRIIELAPKLRGVVNGTKRYAEGYSPYDFWLREWTGINEADGRPTYRLDTRYNAFDPAKDFVRGTDTLTFSSGRAAYRYCGSSIPDWYGGFRTQITFGALELGVQAVYQYGGKYYDAVYAALMALGQYGAALHKDAVQEAWAPPQHTSARAPQLNASYAQESTAASDRWLESASALAIRSAHITILLPGKWISPLGMQSVKLSVVGENLWYITPRPGSNPMANYAGVSDFTYPVARTISGKVEIQF